MVNKHVELIEKVETLQNMLISRAEGNRPDNVEYKALRAELMIQPSLKPRLPRFVRTCRDLPQFWGFIKDKFAHYDERRAFIREAFSPVMEWLEGKGSSPADETFSTVLERFGAETVGQYPGS